MLLIISLYKKNSAWYFFFFKLYIRMYFKIYLQCWLFVFPERIPSLCASVLDNSCQWTEVVSEISRIVYISWRGEELRWVKECASLHLGNGSSSSNKTTSINFRATQLKKQWSSDVQIGCSSGRSSGSNSNEKK